MTNHTCPFPGCTEPPDTQTHMWAQLHSQLLLVAVPVCQDHKRMNEAEIDTVTRTKPANDQNLRQGPRGLYSDPTNPLHQM